MFSNTEEGVQSGYHLIIKLMCRLR